MKNPAKHTPRLKRNIEAVNAKPLNRPFSKFWKDSTEAVEKVE